MNRRVWITLALLMVLCAAAFGARLLVASGSGSGNLDAEQRELILKLRLASAAAALIVGVLLATSGVFLQTLLRNPLASPYILGLAAGAGLGVAVVQFMQRWAARADAAYSSSGLLTLGDELGAAIGAGVVLVLVYSLSQKRGLLDPVSLLLVGVMMSAICGALIMLLEFLAPATDTARLVRWMMGSISELTSWQALAIGGSIAAAGLVVGLALSRALDGAALSDDEARTLGIRIDRWRLALFALSSLMTATAVVLAGPIGFVGLVAPHLARIVVGPKHRGLLIGSACIGATLVLGADASVRLLPRTHGLMPIGIITAGLGGPIFIWLLRRERRLRRDD